MSIERDCQKALQRYLMASYAYYILSDNLMSDTEYDQLGRYLLDHYDQFEHQHKHLVTKGDLEAGTLFALKEEDYPRIVEGGVAYWIEDREQKAIDENNRSIGE